MDETIFNLISGRLLGSVRIVCKIILIKIGKKIYIQKVEVKLVGKRSEGILSFK